MRQRATQAFLEVTYRWPWVMCTTCSGRGEVNSQSPFDYAECSVCKGEGGAEAPGPCPVCLGVDTVPPYKLVEVALQFDGATR